APQLSVIILTHNEEKNLPACLKSLNGLPCQVFVVDSGSTDRSREIARTAGAHVTEHSFENYTAQRNWAQRNLPIRSEWVLHLDADERLTPELRAEIATLFAMGGSQKLKDTDGFMLRKRTFFMNRWIKHGGHYPSFHLRLFRRMAGSCEARLYDQHFVVHGRIDALQHDYLDMLCPDLNRWILRHMRWAELEALELAGGGDKNGRVQPKLFGNPIERRRWLRDSLYNHAPLYLRAFCYWFYRYFFRLGFLDGKEGFVFHILQGFWFRLLVDIKLDELRRNAGEMKSRNSAILIAPHKPSNESH
ncbi:MAG: glycosyltransferase family 2 protein, partial [Deltaproteobacteria bacterium]|nr:glycosyltransferase family 2 protein [Deltaproteobacteria bacterium]